MPDWPGALKGLTLQSVASTLSLVKVVNGVSGACGGFCLFNRGVRLSGSMGSGKKTWVSLSAFSLLVLVLLPSVLLR